VVLTIAAHKLYGKLPWEEVVMPVAELARGWHVSRELARRLRIFGWVRRNPAPRINPMFAADAS
jgi:gamma-glutamyltranspeptidase